MRQVVSEANCVWVASADYDDKHSLGILTINLSTLSTKKAAEIQQR